MIYTSHTDITSASGRPTAFCEADEKEKIILRKYHLYAVGICAAIALGAAGCSAGVNAETMSGSSVAAEDNTEETTVSDTTVVESVTGAIESMEESQPEVPQSVRIYGPVTKMEDGRLSIDNQSGMSTSGEIILNVADDMTYILDAMTGFPVALEDVKDGDTIYAYIGPAMTMSLPPMTNAVMIFTNLPADAKAPDYVEVKSINDTNGHLFGDKVLVDLAAALRLAFRRNDITARIGGDEFIAFMPHIHVHEDVVPKLETILYSLSR